MSPTEDQLRAALSDGEGPGPDADSIIGAAVRIRRQRRALQVRLAGAVCAVILVSGLGVAIVHNSSNSDSSADSGSGYHAELLVPQAAGASSGGGGSAGDDSGYVASGVESAGGSAGGAGAGNAAPTPGQALNGATTTACPSTPIVYTPSADAINGGVSGRGPLVSKPVSSLVFCLFAPGPTYGGSRLLSGADAQSFIDRADASTDTPTHLQCLEAREVEILPYASDGSLLTPLSVSGTCHQVMITNGTAVRFESDSVIDSVTGAIATSPTGMMSGSPPR